mgnify:CR=1 FL=1
MSWWAALDAALSLCSLAEVADNLQTSRTTVRRWMSGSATPRHPRWVENHCIWLTQADTTWRRQINVLHRVCCCAEGPEQERVLSALLLSAGMLLQDVLGVGFKFAKTEVDSSDIKFRRKDGMLFGVRAGMQGTRPYFRLYLPNGDRPRFDADENGVFRIAAIVQQTRTSAHYVAEATLRREEDFDADQERKYHGTS